MEGSGSGLQRWCGVLAPAFLVLAVGGCAGASTAGFGSAGFYHEDQPIFIPYAQGSSGELLGAEWRVVNFLQDEPHPGAQKVGSEMTTTYRVETPTGDSQLSKEVARNDLVLEHTEHDGVIWVRAFPVSWVDEEKDPVVMLRRYVRSLSAPSLSVSMDTAGRADVSGTGKRVPEPFDVVRCLVAERPAARASVVFADPDELRLSPSSRIDRVEVVLVRTGFKSRLPGVTRYFPSWLLLAYANHPNDFERGLADFEQLLQRVALGAEDAKPDEQGRGFVPGLRCAPNGTAPAAEAPAAPAEAAAPDAPAEAPQAAPPIPAPAATDPAEPGL